MLTQYRPHGALAGRRFGGFSGKTSTAGPGAGSHPVGLLTQHRPFGAIAGRRFGSFAGKTPTGATVEWEFAAPLEVTPMSGVLGVSANIQFVVTEDYTSGGVLYIPIRMVSALWSSSGVSGGGEVAWLPNIRQPIAYADGRGNLMCDLAWYRFFEYIAETRLAGKSGPSVTAVVQAVTDVQSTAAAATATVTELQQQTQANAEALYVTREVVKRGGLSGSDQIPFVEL